MVGKGKEEEKVRYTNNGEVMERKEGMKGEEREGQEAST